MLGSVKYTFFIATVLMLSSCASMPKEVTLKTIQLNKDLNITVPAEYKGAGYHATDEGNEFLLSNADKTVKFYFEAAEGMELKVLKYNEIPDSLPGLNQYKEVGNCYLYYTNSNGMTHRNSSAIVFYPLRGDYVEILTVSYVAEKQKEVEQMVKSIK